MSSAASTDPPNGRATDSMASSMASSMAFSPSVATPADWHAYFAGRRVAIADLPPVPPSPTRGGGAFLVRAGFFVLVLLAAVGAGFLIGRASGRWWVGGIVFAIIAWVALLLGIGLVGAAKVEREDRARRFARSREDPIGRLLPSRALSRHAKKLLDPAEYAGLLALEPRPVLVVDLAVTKLVGRTDAIGALAPAGRMPEPEMLDITHRVKGTSFAGLMLILQGWKFWTPIASSLMNGAPLSWEGYFGFCLVGVAIWLVLRDPLVHRFFGFVGWRRQESIIGAGWIRDDRGEIWTVDDSILLVTMQGQGVEVRLVKRDRVRSYHLSAGTQLLRSRQDAERRAAKRRVGKAPTIGDMARGAVRSVGVEPSTTREHEMPTSKEPLRLLLSSWTYPEPRTDLAMRE